MKIRLLVSVGVIMICAGIVWFVSAQRNAAVVDDPVQQLREEVAAAPIPIEVIRAAPADVAGRLILSMGQADASKQSLSVAVLEVVAADAGDSLESLGLARNSVIAAAQSLATTGTDSEYSGRLRAILLRAADHSIPRMQSTFLTACQEFPAVASDVAVRTAIERIVARKDPTLNISDRATQLLASLASPSDPKEGSPK